MIAVQKVAHGLRQCNHRGRNFCKKLLENSGNISLPKDKAVPSE